MLYILIHILVALIIFALVYWVFTQLPLPPPIANIARVVLVVLFCLWLIYELLGVAGGVGHPLLR